MRTKIKKKDNCALYLEKERKEGKKRNNLRWQSDHHTLSRVIPFGREHDNAYKETMEDQVWQLGSVTRATWKV
jgi:hypothetical protein